MLSAAKHLAAHRERPFAALRVTLKRLWLRRRRQFACAMYMSAYNLFAALWPPTDDAAQQHKHATIPDKWRQRVDEDTDGRLRRALPVGQEHVDIGQAKG